MLPASRGDCLWIEYGDNASPSRILIDGGLMRTGRALRQRILELPEVQRRFMLVIVTHVDLDHIGGILELFRDPPKGLVIDDLWFNGWDELEGAQDLNRTPGVLGPKQGESVSYYIASLKLTQNDAFGGGPVVRVPDEQVPMKSLPGGMTVRLLGPTPQRLAELLPVWKRTIEELNLVPGQCGQILEKADEKPDVRGVLGGGNLFDRLLAAPYEPDSSEANGSSIAVLLDYDGRRLLCTGDAFADDLTNAAVLVAKEDGVSRLNVTAAKLSHHGGRKNTSIELIKTLRCRQWLISTDGSSYQHPHGESLARVIKYANAGGETSLHFNYNTEFNALWRDRVLQNSEKFTAKSPTQGDEGLSLELN